MMTRRAFLALNATLPLLAVAPPAPPPPPGERFGSALVLGGGGARGAYEAGVIEGLRRAAGVADGHPIPGIDVVCGTSIGAVNAWFVATAQYSALAALWRGISSERIFTLKPRFAAVTRPSSGVLTRISQALSLAGGLTKDVAGILDGDRIADWIARHVEPRTPLIVPYVLTVTNLDRQRSEVFFRAPFAADPIARAKGIERLHATVGTATAIRDLSDGVLRTAIRASAAIPVLLDPVVFVSPEGTPDRYVDGGIADNNPIDVGRALARAVYAVMVDAEKPPRQAYASALSIGIGAFGVAQTRILEASLRSTYLETRGRRLFAVTPETPEQRRFAELVLDTDLFTIRPASEPPVQFVEFDEQAKIDATYDEGVRDIAAGWQPYVFAPDAG